MADPNLIVAILRQTTEGESGHLAQTGFAKVHHTAEHLDQRFHRTSLHDLDLIIRHVATLRFETSGELTNQECGFALRLRARGFEQLDDGL